MNLTGGPKDDSEKYNPSEWVQNLINNVKSEGHKAHGVFSELDVLKEYNGNIEWREAARYDHRKINFEIITHSPKKKFQKYGCLEEFIFADVKLFLRQLTFEKKGFKHVSNF